MSRALRDRGSGGTRDLAGEGRHRLATGADQWGGAAHQRRNFPGDGKGLGAQAARRGHNYAGLYRFPEWTHLDRLHHRRRALRAARPSRDLRRRRRQTGLPGRRDRRHGHRAAADRLRPALGLRRPCRCGPRDGSGRDRFLGAHARCRWSAADDVFVRARWPVAPLRRALLIGVVRCPVKGYCADGRPLYTSGAEFAPGHRAMESTPEGSPRPAGMGRLIEELLRPYRGWLAIILLATAVETAMGLAAPWPLKIVLDNVIGGDQPPGWLRQIASWLPGDGVMQTAAFAAISTVIIAAVGALASYLDNYYTESVGQWVANDLRVRVYHHRDHLPLAYSDTHQTGTLLSTITDDIATIQGFACSATLGIVVDLLTIAGMLGLMFWLNWDFALIAVGVAPFLLLFVVRFRKAVKKATREVRRRESDIVGVVQQGLESIRVVNAFGRQELEEEHLQQASRAAVQAALKARRVKALLSPVVVVTVSLCTAVVLWRGASLVLASAMTAGSLTVFLSYLGKFFKPVPDLAKSGGTIAQATVR